MSHRSRQPVRARRGEPGYRAGKLFERHRLAAIPLTLVLIVGLLAIANHLWQARALIDALH